MGPLVYYCRWRGAKLRLRGRDDTAVWGELITTEDDQMSVETFHFDLRSWELWLGKAPGRRLQLDELGVVTEEGPAANPTANAR